MITRQNTQKVIQSLRELEWREIRHHPQDVLWNRSDYRHFHRLRELAEQRAWDVFVTTLRSGGETHVWESVQTLIKQPTPRWYHQYLAR